jgi:hypothetical protein
LRAIADLAADAAHKGLEPVVAKLLAHAYSVSPYVEQSLGLLNAYANDVLTGSSNPRHWIEMIERSAATIRRPK